MKKFLIIIAGPTAVGKTSVAIELAKVLQTEIISADSRQFYRELKIGVASPLPEQLKSVKHHFIGNLSVHDYYNVSAFESDVLGFLKDHYAVADKIIMAGGSGLYIDAVCRGIDRLPDPDMYLRKEIKENFYQHGLKYLQQRVFELDPEYYRTVDLNNPNRLIRAIEVSVVTGHPYSSFRRKEFMQRDFICIKIGLNLPREELFARIEERVDQMISAGLPEEVRSLLPQRHLNALNTVGYKEIFAFLDGESTWDVAVGKIKTNTRRYARRQLTWFKKDESMVWFHPADLAGMMDHLRQRMSQ
ncbi:MAG: tRNA (adenosine(37)-N6)-dimethylallyltransferase MiaA [Bacteroidales bacterium]|nr:tRNA (adenosine(37)-N6)-dimethylallyltransferase MiaA [Bacteroidales bacterium]